MDSARDLRQLLDCACPSGALYSRLIQPLSNQRTPDPKRQKRQPHSRTLARGTAPPNLRQLLDCAYPSCPSGAFYCGTIPAL